MDENESLADPLVRRDITPGSEIGQREQNLSQREQNLTEDKSRFATKTDIFEKTAGRYWWYAGMIVLVLVALGLSTGALVKETSSVSSLEAAVSASTLTNPHDQKGIVVTKSGTNNVLGLDFTKGDSNLNYLDVTPGTAKARRALVLDAIKGINGVSSFTGVSLIEAENINVTNLNYSNFTVSGNFETGDLDTNTFISIPNTAINSGIIGGNGNTNIGSSCFIGGGRNNNIEYGVSECCIIGGSSNILDLSPGGANTGNVIIGGTTNEINNTAFSVITGGNSNIINDNTIYSTINGGVGNLITDSVSFSGINGGRLNVITNSYSFIGGGLRNGVSGTRSGIIGGEDNRVSGNRSGIVSGHENKIATGSNNSIILAGSQNGVSSTHSGIVAGKEHHISAGASFSVIAGGVSNSISDVSMSTILGGSDNNIRGTGTSCGIFSSVGSSIVGGSQSVIVGGNYNTVGQSQSGIFAGGYNTIENNNNDEGNTVIIGGGNNTINTDSGPDYGWNGIFSSKESGISGATKHSLIAGGKNHKIDDAEKCCIAGGTSLKSNGSSYANSLICGQYNDPGFFPWAKSGGTQTVSGTSFRFSVGAGSGDSDNNLGFAVDNVGNIYFGTTAGCSIYQRTSASGSTQYHAKSFTIQHPTDDERWLRHGCLEGPEAGVYYRGKDTAPTTIKLPEYAPKIASNFTVQITPIGEPRMMSSSEVSEEGNFQVFGEGKFHWHVTGTRLEMETQPLKKDITIKNFGPYSWSE